MSLELLCMAVIGLGFGLIVAFWGYKLLWIILPIWGFFAGFALGAQTIDIILNEGFLASITGWVVGFGVGAIFAILSYLFYFLAVALLSGAFGYGVTVGILTWLFDKDEVGFLFWLIGIVVGVAVAVLVLRFNIQKYAVIAINDSWLWFLYFVIVGAAGIYFQLQTNKDYEIEEYNRWAG